MPVLSQAKSFVDTTSYVVLLPTGHEALLLLIALLHREGNCEAVQDAESDNLNRRDEGHQMNCKSIFYLYGVLTNSPRVKRWRGSHLPA